MPMNLMMGGIGVADVNSAQVNRLEATPLAFGDFVADTYEIDGEGVARTDFFLQEGGNYNAANFSAGNGITWVEGGNYFVLLDPAAFAGAESGFTAVIEALVPGGTQASAFAYENQNFVPFFNFTIQTVNEEFTGVFTTATDNTASINLSPTELPEGIHRFAVTYASGRMAMSVDGGAVIDVSSGTPETWATLINEFGVGVGAGVAGTYHRHLAIYEVQEDSALPVLSAL